MSETAKQLFEAAKVLQKGITEAMPGLKNFGPEVKAELSRLGTQGSMELASALFNGQGFVPCGPGQYTPTPEQAQSQENTVEREMDHGRER
jgi:hypothetical protein